MDPACWPHSSRVIRVGAWVSEQDALTPGACLPTASTRPRTMPALICACACVYAWVVCLRLFMRPLFTRRAPLPPPFKPC